MTYHMADKVNGATGDVSALCFDTPRSIDMKKESWVLRPGAVTCVACKAALRARRKIRATDRTKA